MAAAAAPAPATALIPTAAPQQATRACYFWMLLQLPPRSFLNPYQNLTFIPQPHCFLSPTHMYTHKKGEFKKKEEQHLGQQTSPPTLSVSNGNGQVLGKGQQQGGWIDVYISEECPSEVGDLEGEIPLVSSCAMGKPACLPWGQDSCLCPPP